MLPTTITEVIARLDDIIAWARESNSRIGYFATLYRTVTVRVRDGIANGIFEDNPRMEELDVRFANRYLDAFDRYRAGTPTSRSWQLAFATGERWWPIVLQHLLLGINAHINLDLGIAAAQTSPGHRLPELRSDFDRINAILASMVDGVQTRLARVWPLLRLLDWVGGPHDEAVIHFSIEQARRHAWDAATRLAPLDREHAAAEIDRIDRETTEIGRLIRHPGPVLAAVTKVIRLGELRSVPRVIDVLT